MTYEIKYEPVTVENVVKPKYNIYYTGGEFDGLGELYEMEGFKGVIRNGYTALNAPNYYGLEQGLFKSSIFSKYFSYYKSGGLYFQKVVDNGKDGYDVDQFRVIQGLISMEIPFTDPEKDFINNVLTQNNFSVQIP